jgi:hypothetical protein
MTGLSVICVPVLLDTNTEVSHLYRQWARLYHYGHICMPTMAVSATGMYAYAALRYRAANNKQWLVYAIAGATTIAIVPFTWLIMTSTNNTLFRLHELAVASPETGDLSTAHELLVKWAWLHLCRSVFPLAGAIVGFFGVLKELGI